MEFSWIVLSVGLALISLGFSGLLTLLFSIFVFLCGAFAIVLGISLSSTVSSKVERLTFYSRQTFSPPKLKVSVTDSEEAFYSTSGLSISGSEVIEAPLSEILSFVFRDYIHSWHFKLTHSKAFPLQLQESLHFALRVLAKRIQDVDWIPFLTTRLVDDVASHVRLFKKARFALKTRGKDDGKIVDLESLFFDAEVAMEGNLCRDLASSIQQEEQNYLQQLAELLLFLLLPKRDFPALPLRSMAREILVNFVLKPMLEQLSDPDVINQTILWILKDNKIKPDYFISAIKCSESLEELSSTKDVVSRDIGTLRSMDSLGEKNASLKQQLNSLLYLKKIIDNRMNRLHTKDTDSYGEPSQIDWNQTVSPDTRLFLLPLEDILKNGLSLSYFIDYMTSIGNEAYLFFYLNIEGWKVSAEQNLQALEFETMKLSQQEEEGIDPDLIKQGSKLADNHRSILLEKMREDAHSIYEGYLSEKANPRLKIDETVIKKLIFKIRSGAPDIDMFDDCQKAIYDKLEHDERFLDTFRRSVGYKTLLAELDLPKGSSKSDDEDDGQSSLAGDDYSIYDTLSVNSSDGSSNMTNEDKKCSSKEDLLDDMVKASPKTHKRSGSTLSSGRQSQSNNDVEVGPSLKTEVLDYIVVKDGAKQFAQYTIRVTHVDEKGRETISTIYRRYSDFLNLHDQVCLKSEHLSNLNFPSKKAFGNMDKKVLDARREMFDEYLKALIMNITTEANYELMPILQWFLDQESFESLKLNQPSNVTKAVRSSVKSVTHLVTSVPNNLIHSVDTVMDGISKVLLSKPGLPTVADGKVGAVLESDTSDNIPLRIMLLFMDEVFDLKERNQWLRRQIVSVLRQLIKAMFGDIVNRRIIDYFAHMTSPETISNYLGSLKESWWPDGYPAAPRQPRDDSTKNRTRVAARAALFSSFSDDLRRVIGSETAKSGVIMIFDLLQHPVLNKRLAIVLLEGILETLFHQHGFRKIFEQLHSRSNRVRNELKNSQRTFHDIRR